MLFALGMGSSKYVLHSTDTVCIMFILFSESFEITYASKNKIEISYIANIYIYIISNIYMCDHASLYLKVLAKGSNIFNEILII